MSVVLTPEQECAASTLDLRNNSTAWSTAEQALESAMTAMIVGGDGCTTADTLCVIDETTDAFVDLTAAYETACLEAGGSVLVEPRVDVTCVDATNTAGPPLYQLSFRNIDICASPTDCTASMTEFLFLAKGRDVLDALFDANDAAAAANTEMVCYEANDDCSFVRASPGAPEVNIASLPGCPTLAPTTQSPTLSSSSANGRTSSSSCCMSWMLTAFAMVWVWKKSW